jgi:hypothetical protein
MADSEESFLSKIGSVGVDGADCRIDIGIGDAVSPKQITFTLDVFSPQGDGTFPVYVGHIKGIGRVAIVAFDQEQEEGEE